MPVARVSLDGEAPTTCTVELRTAALRPGVLCDIRVDEQMQLCVVESIGADGAITARRLPTPRAAIHSRPGFCPGGHG